MTRVHNSSFVHALDSLADARAGAKVRFFHAPFPRLASRYLLLASPCSFSALLRAFSRTSLVALQSFASLSAVSSSTSRLRLLASLALASAVNAAKGSVLLRSFSSSALRSSASHSERFAASAFFRAAASDAEAETCG